MSEFRPTKDIDVLGRTASNEAGIIAQIREILVTMDGIPEKNSTGSCSCIIH